jgi:pimeloyl-ACP methyl ester carboxylesterase
VSQLGVQTPTAGVEEEEVSFHSRGRKIRGTLYLPCERVATGSIVHANGFGGVRRAIVPGYGRAFARRGYAFLAFDYRGFGETGGPPSTGPVAHVEDVRSGLDFFETRTDLPAASLGVFGDAGTGGAVACTAAALDERVRCVVASAALADGAVWLRNMRSSPTEWEAFVARVIQDRHQRVLTGPSEQVDAIGDVLIPSKERQEAVARGEFAAPETIEGGAPIITLEYVDELMTFRPVDVVSLIAPRAAMWICYEDDPVCPVSEARRMFERAGEPKRLEVISDVPHYRRHMLARERIVDLAAEWFAEHLTSRGDHA